MGLLDFLDGSTARRSGGMSPITMALLGLLA
jgi:phosphatidylglycerophosphate synthase